MNVNFAHAVDWNEGRQIQYAIHREIGKYNEIHLYALLKIFFLDMCLVVWSAGEIMSHTLLDI